MPLNPTFSLTPLNPFSSEYDWTNDLYKHWAELNCYGAYIPGYYPLKLSIQCAADKVVFRFNRLDSPAPVTVPSNFYQKSCAMLDFRTNATPDNQYLLVYHLSVPSNLASKAAFYINGNLVREEWIKGEQYVAILMVCPSPQTFTRAYMFLTVMRTLELRGIECYIL